MKTNTFNQLFLTLLGILLINTFTSASDIKIYDGYVILNSGEKLEGQIEMLGPTLNEVKIKLINKNELRYLKAKEVKEYSFEVKKWNNKTRKHTINKITYVRQKVERAPIAFGPKEVLLEREIVGAINLYNHFIEQNTSIEEPFIHIIYIQHGKNGELVSITKTNYKETLKRMVASYPELKAKVGTKGYGFTKLTKIILSYNEWIKENGEEVVGM